MEERSYPGFKLGSTKILVYKRKSVSRSLGGNVNFRHGLNLLLSGNIDVQVFQKCARLVFLPIHSLFLNFFCFLRVIYALWKIPLI